MLMCSTKWEWCKRQHKLHSPVFFHQPHIVKHTAPLCPAVPAFTPVDRPPPPAHQHTLSTLSKQNEASRQLPFVFTPPFMQYKVYPELPRLQQY